jgi:hypothetical protein
VDKLNIKAPFLTRLLIDYSLRISKSYDFVPLPLPSRYHPVTVPLPLPSRYHPVTVFGSPLPFSGQRYPTSLNVTSTLPTVTDRYRILPLLALQALPILNGPFEQIFKDLLFGNGQ